jgi:hypothetical protein
VQARDGEERRGKRIGRLREEEHGVMGSVVFFVGWAWVKYLGT